MDSLLDITDRKRAEDRVRREAARSEALVEISHALVEVYLDYQAVLDTVVRRTAELTGDACIIYLLSEDGEWLNSAAYHHPNPKVLTIMQDFFAATSRRVNDGLSRRVMQTGQPVLIPVVSPEQAYDLFKHEKWPYLDHFGIHSLLIIPMFVQGSLIGTLNLLRLNSGQPYNSDDMSFFQNLTNQVSLTIANARLFKEAQRRLDHLQALRSIDMAITGSLDLRFTLNVVIDQVTAQLNIHAADILLFNSHMNILEYAAGRGFRSKVIEHTRQRLGNGIAGRVALERRIIHIPNFSEAEEVLTRADLLTKEDFVAYYGVPLIAKGQVKGVLEIFHRTPLNPDSEWLNFLEALAVQAAIAIDNAYLFNELQRSNVELTLAYDATIEGWSRALDLRDKETEGHSHRVTELTLCLARAMGIGEAELVHVRRGALLHDIGKMGIPDSILLKPGPLTDEEWEIMRHHPGYAFEMLSPIEYLSPALDIPYCHHEKWDGTGYPRGLKGKQIPLAARIFAVVDMWDALHSDRPYRPGWTEDKVREYIREQSGKHFDPKVVKVFLKIKKQ